MKSEKIFWDEPLKLISWGSEITDFSVWNDVDRKIEMTSFESGFLCGLLKRERPKKILEVGVAAGGTSAVLLKSIAMLDLDAKLYSVDLCHKYYANPSRDVGYMVKETVPELMPCWKLFTGNIVAEYLEEIGTDIDFCILDTAHTLPGELLDFLCVLPYLKRDAIVVLHDTSLHFMSPDFRLAYATQILMSVVVADKILPSDDYYIENIGNIGAFRIISNTYRYIENVFCGLKMPWSYIPDDIYLIKFDNFFRKHYNRFLCDIFRQTTNINCIIKNNKFRFDRVINYTNIFYPQEDENYSTNKDIQDKEELNSQGGVRNIYLCFSCDTIYVQHFIVALTSILHNTSKEDHLIIYLISNNLSSQDKELILSLKNIQDFEVSFLSVTDDKFKIFQTSCHVSIATYFRLLIPEIIPSYIDKILYLDCDIIVQESLYNLYNIDIKQYYMAAVEDISSYGTIQYNLKNYKIYREKYFNAGVLLLNLEKLRTFELYKRACEFIEKKGQPRWWDQDILNMLFEVKDVLFLPFYFNMQYWYSGANYRADEYLMGKNYEYLHNIVIIHFITDVKPWHNVNLTHAANSFVKKYYFYLRLSCYCGKVQSFPLGIPYNSHILLLGFDPICLDICKNRISKIQTDANIVTEVFKDDAQFEKYYINYDKFDAIFIIQPNSINSIGFSYLKENDKCSVFIIDNNCESIIYMSTPHRHKIFGICEQTPQEGIIPSVTPGISWPTADEEKKISKFKYYRYKIFSKVLLGKKGAYYKDKYKKSKSQIISSNLVMKYPKWMINFIACFIPKRKNRHHLRTKYSRTIKG